MKGSYRYHVTKKPIFKSGDSGDDDTMSTVGDDSIDTDDWVLWEDMKFLSQNKRQRK